MNTLEIRSSDALPAEATAIGLVVTTADGEFVIERAVRVPDSLRAAVDTLVPADPDAQWLRSQGFSGSVGQSFVLRSAGVRLSVVLIGAGDRGSVTKEVCRQVGASFVTSASESQIASLVVPEGLGELTASEIAESVCIGVRLGGYRFDRYRSKPKPPTLSTIVLASREPLEEGIDRAEVITRAVVFARDLINSSAREVTPATLSDALSQFVGTRPHVSVEIWDDERLRVEKMGGILGVGQGSDKSPRLFRATYDSPGATTHIVLVGKGVTFDSGGLTIKPKEGMTTMKTDMSGAAIVCCVLAAIADLGVKVKVTAIAPMAENMLDAASVKPGDVLTIRDGQTIEVTNTDAEGRLILADALCLARELAPDLIIDVATLTGAVTVALGPKIAGIFGNDQSLVDRLMRIGRECGENLWQLPLATEYNDHIDSEVADMKNEGRPGQAGSIAGALLLVRFIGSIPWAHLDIAGTGRSAEANGYLAKGGTAFSARTLIELIASYAS